MEDRIRFSINNLDDAYPCSLMTLKEHGLTQKTIDSETRSLIDILQNRFSKDISHGKVEFRHMIHLPLLWIRAGWEPSYEIIFAMIRAYIAVENENSLYYEHSTEMLQSLTENLLVARRLQTEMAKVRYTTLGKHKTNVKTLCLLPARDLAAAIYHPLLYRWKALIVKGTIPTPKQMAGLKIVESFYADYLINQPKMSYHNLSRIPAIWSDTGWCPQSDMVKAIILGYTNIYIQNGKKSQEAAQIIDKLSKVSYYAEKTKQPTKVPYHLLGKTDNKHLYVKIISEVLSQSLPHKYILILRKIANSDNLNFPIQGSLFESFKRAENHFIRQLNKANECPPLVLPELWNLTNNIPPTELVMALIKCYVLHATRNEIIGNYLNSIIDAQKYAEKKGQELTKIDFCALGSCSESCTRFVLLNTKELKKVLVSSTP